MRRKQARSTFRKGPKKSGAVVHGEEKGNKMDKFSAAHVDSVIGGRETYHVLFEESLDILRGLSELKHAQHPRKIKFN